MATVIDTPAGIERFGLVSLRASVRLEMKGLKRRGESAMKMAKRELGRRGKTYLDRPITPERRVPAEELMRLLTEVIGA
jgi:hypothetical protein